MTVQKIKIKSLEKTAEYINREWSEVLARRQYLLNSTDWTQLEDNELTFESRVRWNKWRNDVRAIRRDNCADKEEADEKLKVIEGQMPSRDFIQSHGPYQKKYHLDLTNLEQARNDAMTIMRKLHEDWLLNYVPENVNMVNAKYDEMIEYNTFKRMKKPPLGLSIDDYPLLKLVMEQQGIETDEWLIAYISDLKRACREVYLMVEKHRFNFTKQITEAKSIEDIVGIVKNMHGY